MHLRFSDYSCLKFGISKIKFFNFSITERVKQNQKNIKTIQNLLTLKFNPFSRNFNKCPISFGFFTETLTISLPVRHWADINTDLHSDSNISQAISTNIAFTDFLKEYLI